jgi:protein-L-isoaspartate(D-aspartate) O-methyltransferase
MQPLSAEADREATAAFLLRVRSRGLRDLAVLRALEATPRTHFTPQRYRDLAFRELSLPIACGQVMPDPYFVAALAGALAVEPHHRVLEIGSGSGYCTAVLARLAGEVVSLERYRSLAIEAGTRLEHVGVKNARCLWGDGRDPPPTLGRFDRVVVHASLESIPPGVGALLAPAAALVAGAPAQRGVSDVLIWERAREGDPLSARLLAKARLRPLEPGLSRGL